MGSRGVVFAVVCMVALVVLTPARSDGRQREGLASAARDVPRTGEDMVEQLLIKCGKELMGMNHILKSSVMEGMVGDSTDVNSDFVTRENIRKALALVPLEIKQAITDCLRKHNFPIHIFGEGGGTEGWQTGYFEFLLSRHAASRRNLADRAIQIMAKNFHPEPSILSVAKNFHPEPSILSVSSISLASAPSLDHAPASSPSHAPAPAPNLVSNPAPNPIETPSSSPVPSPNMAPVDAPVPSADIVADTPPPTSRHKKGGAVADKASGNATTVPLDKKSDSMKPIVVAAVLSGTGSFILAAIFFYCYNRCRRNYNRSESGQRDERPLLTLSLSDFSSDSSRKSYGLRNSMHNDKNGTLSFKTDLNQNGLVSPSDISSDSNPSSAAMLETTNTSVAPSSALNNVPEPKPPPPPPPPVVPPPIKKAPPPPGPPPPPPPTKPGLRPPPPPKAAAPRPPQLGSSSVRTKSPLGPKRSGNTVSCQETGENVEYNASKTKLKPFFWDKVLANPDQSMVWHQISSGSFQFNEEMIESLFGCSAADKQKGDGKKVSSAFGAVSQQIQLLEPKKSQNLAILLRALNVTTEEVCDALMEGNELPSELLQTLLKMAPTPEEELKLRLYNGEMSQIGNAERFLKALVDIPFAFKRLDALLFMGSLEEDISTIKEAFTTLETACKELRSSRLFLKLLEAVLKTGNRMNDGTYRGGAQAFKLDTLLKLADVKGTDGKTTLLHFVVQEIIRSEGMKAARRARESGSLSGITISSFNSDDFIDDSPHDTSDHFRSLGLKVVSGLGNEIENVKKAAGLDVDTLTSMVANLGHGLVKTKEFLNKDMKSMNEDSGFHHSLVCFVEHAEEDVTSLLGEEKRMRALVKSTTDYFHGNAGKDEGLRLFVIVRDFLGMLEKVCNEVKQAPKKVQKVPVDKEAPIMQPVPDHRRLLFPAIKDRRVDQSSSEEDSP